MTACFRLSVSDPEKTALLALVAIMSCRITRHHKAASDKDCALSFMEISGYIESIAAEDPEALVDHVQFLCGNFSEESDPLFVEAP